MNTYVVTLKSTGQVVYRYGADAPVEWSGMEFSTHDHTTEVSEVTDVVVKPSSTKITKLAFRSRFTQAEKVAIEIAGLDNPSATMQARAAAAGLRSYQADINVATYIDLNRADTRSGVQTLEQFGLLAAGRASVILDTTPTAEELYHGS